MESKNKISNNENEHNNLKSSDFQDLTPIDDADLTGYKEALDLAFNDDKIKNIAITGSYGSGKSSILNTYKKDSKLKFIHISFLHFKECDKNDTNTNENKEKSNNKEDSKESKDIEENKEQNSKNKDVEKNKIEEDTTKIEFSLDCGNETKDEIDKEKIREAVLERKIINHIINQIPFKYISDTNFNIRSVLGTFEIFKKIVYTLILISSILYINYFLREDKSNFYNFLNSSLSNINHILLVIGIFNIGFFIYKNFSNKYKEKSIKFLKKIMLLIFPIISFTYLVVYIWFNDILNELIYKFKDSYTLVSLSFLYIIIYFSIFIGKLNKRSVLNKLKYKYKGIELDISTQKNGEEYNSFFDKYLNEILYIFENCNADVIVFEDIDRFEMGVIFERLREINILLNEKLKKKNKVIKFCYLMKDDIFSSEDRVKFFDFIIPVVSVMNGFNSNELFFEYFSKYFLKDSKNINKYDFYEFMGKISFNITNIRILKNIFNEFVIYRGRLDKKLIKLNYYKLLSIIVYKNLFPEDFNNLNHNEGFLFNIFRNPVIKDYVKDDLINNMNEKEIEYKIELENLLKKINIKVDYTITHYEIDSFIITRILKECINLDKDFINFINVHYKNRILDNFDNINFYYKQIPNDVIDLRKQILKYEYFIYCIYQKRGSELSNELFLKLFNRSIIDIKLIGDEKYKDLLIFFTRNGFLDESCGEYITYFSSNNLNLSDRKFIMNALYYYDNKLPYDYKLTNVEFIKFSLNSIYYINDAILNFDLLDNLLNEYDVNVYIKDKYYNRQLEIKLEYFLLQLSKFKNLDFIKGYFDRNQYNNKKLNRFLMINLNTKNIKLENINDDLDSDLFDIIVNYDLYELNEINLITVLNKLCDSKDLTDENIKHKNYSLICNAKDNKICKYIHSSHNIYKYLEVYIKFCDDVIKDDEEHVISLIEILFGKKYEKYSIESEGLFIRYIERLVTKIKLISKIDLQYLNNYKKNILYQELFKYNVVNCFVENIYEYYLNNNKMDEVIIKFINESNEELKFYNKCSDYDIKDVKSFLNELKNDERIKEDKRAEIQSCIDELDKF